MGSCGGPRGWIRADFTDAADGILHANADACIRRVFELRER